MAKPPGLCPAQPEVTPVMKYHEQPARPVCQREPLSRERAASTGRWLWLTMMVTVPMLLDGEWSNAIRPDFGRQPGQEKRCWCGPTLPVGLRPLNTKRKGSGAKSPQHHAKPWPKNRGRVSRRTLIFASAKKTGNHMVTREVKIILAIDSALTEKRGSLTPWEINFLNGLRTAYVKSSSLSVKQKTIVTPILKRLGLLSL